MPEDIGPRASRVLAVEDDPKAYELIASALGSAGYLAIRARHGDEALRLAKDSRPAAVTLDLVLPGMSGFEVAGSLKENPLTANIPILILTSKEISTEDRNLLHTKVSSFVQKGTSAKDQLVREIRRVTAPPSS